MVAAHFALVRHASQSARSGQNSQQRQFRQTDRRGAVVHENNFIASQRQLVATSGRRSIAGGKKLQSRMRARVLDSVPRFIREFAEVYLPSVRGQPEHINVGARTKNTILCAGDNNRTNLRMFKSNAL